MLKQDLWQLVGSVFTLVAMFFIALWMGSHGYRPYGAGWIMIPLVAVVNIVRVLFRLIKTLFIK